MRREGAKGNASGDADVDLLKKMEPLQGMFLSVYSSSYFLRSKTSLCQYHIDIYIMCTVCISYYILFI
jgi:hypothetical protein